MSICYYQINNLRRATMLSSTPSYLIPAMARTRLRHSVPTHTRISANKQKPRPQPAKFIPDEKRMFSRSSTLNYPRKDSQDRSSISTEATEYSKSGTDDETAQQDDPSFDPKLTDPGAQKAEAGENNQVGYIILFPRIFPIIIPQWVIPLTLPRRFDLASSVFSSFIESLIFPLANTWDIFQGKTNPLEVSPANPDVSKQREPAEGGAENSGGGSGSTSDKRQRSGGGSPSKGGQVS